MAMGDDFTHQGFGKFSSSNHPQSCFNGNSRHTIRD
jgi:hypothetical protein